MARGLTLKQPTLHKTIRPEITPLFGKTMLDLDSTVFCQEAQQEGARKGFNPRHKGRNTHHPSQFVRVKPYDTCHMVARGRTVVDFDA
jgi:hypothetical protein